MITKKDLKECLGDSIRNALIKRIEEYLDKEIKKELLKGKTVIRIGTMREDPFPWFCKTDFHKLWCSKEISEEALKDVRESIVFKYSDLFYIEVEHYLYGDILIFRVRENEIP